jgi:hypothetical protein
MRIAIITLGLFLIAGLFFYNYTSNKEILIDQSKLSPSEYKMTEVLSEKDLAFFDNRLNPDNKNSKWIKSILNFKYNPKDIPTKENGKEIVELVNIEIQNLTTCLKDENCRAPEDLKSKTLLMKRYLLILKATLEQYPVESQRVSWEQVRGLVGLPFPEIQGLVSDILRFSNEKNDGKKEFKKIIALYSGAEKAKVLKNMAQDLLPDERSLFINAVSESLKDDSFDTLKLIISNLRLMKMNDVELIKMLNGTCLLKEDIKNKLGEELKKIHLNMQSICH